MDIEKTSQPSAEREYANSRQLLADITRELKVALQQFPSMRSGVFRQYYIGYYQSLRITYELLSHAARQADDDIGPAAIERVAQAAVDSDDDLADLLQRQSEHDRACLLVIIEVADALQRVVELSIPTTPATRLIRKSMQKAAQVARRLRSLQCRYANASAQIGNYLAQNGVTLIALKSGDYPMADSTRILQRIDEHTDDAVEIATVVEPGYRWRGRILRKAAVIVVSQKGE